LKFSIIIATLNNENTIKRNLESIKSQSFTDYEIIIVDGGSKDKSIKIIKSFDFKDIKIKTQNRKGVYNAFNEGINSSIGEIIIILNADDFFCDKDSLKIIQQQFHDNHEIDLLMTNVKMINIKNKIVRVYKNNQFKNFMLYFGFMPPHTGIFVKKKVYNKFGTFIENFENAGDFEFLVRILLKENVRYKKISNYLVSMSIGGKSNKNIISFLTNTKEIKKALRLNGYFSSYLLIMIRLILKIFQFRL